MLGRRDAKRDGDHKLKNRGKCRHKEGDEHVSLDDVNDGHHLGEAFAKVQRDDATQPLAVAHVVHFHDGLLGCFIYDSAALIHRIDLVLRKAGGHVLDQHKQDQRHTKQDQYR